MQRLSSRRTSATQVSPASRRQVVVEQRMPSKSILVSNLPIEATYRTLMIVFGSYGTIASCNVMVQIPPRSADAVIEYTAASSAVAAVENQVSHPLSLHILHIRMLICARMTNLTQRQETASCASSCTITDVRSINQTLFPPRRTVKKPGQCRISAVLKGLPACTPILRACRLIPPRCLTTHCLQLALLRAQSTLEQIHMVLNMLRSITA